MPTRATKRALAVATATVLSTVGLQVAQTTVVGAHADGTVDVSPVDGPPGFAMAEPTGRAAYTDPAPASSADAAVTASYAHSPAPNSGQDLPAGDGDIMPSTTLYYVFWLPTGQHFESNDAGDTQYENLLIQWAKDVGSTSFHNLVTQYDGNNGGISGNVSYGASWTDTAAYPHAGTAADPLTDQNIRDEVARAVDQNGWAEDLSHMVAVFTANGIFECNGGSCMDSASGGFCAYHNHFDDSGDDAVYAFMGFDNFTHRAGSTCVAGETGGDNDPNRGSYPNGDKSADAEINTLSHEVIEAETDPHPNDTWTGPNGEIGDACNYNFAPRDDSGADVYLNGHGYILQQEWSNAVHTCAIDLPGNGHCAGSVSQVCSPTTTFGKTVDNDKPHVDSTVTYTMTLHNTSDSGAETNLTVNDTLPSGYTVTSVDAPSSTSSNSTSNSVTVTYDTLAVHTTRTITVQATVPEQAGTTATNCGSLTGSDLIGTALPSATTSPCASTTPVKVPTQTSYSGDNAGDYNDAANVSAVLTDDGGNAVAGKTIDFTLNNAETCSATTDASGVAGCQITPGEPAGSYDLKAVFGDGSDPKYDVSSTTTSFEVKKEETTTSYTGPSVILKGANGVTLQGQLLEDGATPIQGRTLTLGLGSQTCTGTTDATGVATCALTFTGALGNENLSATFAGDDYYLPSSDTSQTAIVFAFPARGAFTIGDITNATATPSTDVTWWADTWNQLNTTSGGVAPSSFKGFAGTVSLPTSTPPSSCGSGWQTGPGNSPPPAADIPGYMGVLVTSRVTKSGSTISGNTTHIVVVKVGPGYSPDPSHHGIGKIVAVYC